MANIIKIEDFFCQELDVYARKTEAQLLNKDHPEDGLFIAESPKVIQRALDAGYEPVSCLMEEKHIEDEGASILAQCGEIPVYTASFEVLKQLTGFPLTRGMLCCMRRKRTPEPEVLCQDKNKIVLLENVMNPTNVGAIFRSAAALNMDAILLTGGCSDPFYRRSARVSMGTVFQIPWTWIKDESPVMKLKEMGYCTVAMALKEDSCAINDPVFKEKKKLGIVLGTEGEGLSDSTIEQCDYTVMIPMAHGVDSLNVASASAVAFWELGKD